MMKLFAAVTGFAGVSAWQLSGETSMTDKLMLDATFRAQEMDAKVKSMSKEEALNNLKDKKLDSTVMTALQTAKLKKETAHRAVVTLNEMYLEAEKELDEKIFACTVQRLEMRKDLEITESELQALGAAGDDANKAKKEGEDLGAAADQAIGQQNNDLELLTKAYEGVKAEDDAELGELQATLAVMSFILEIAQCKTKGLLLNQKVDATVLSCEQQNAQNGNYLVNLFADKNLQEKVEAELTATQREKLSAILGDAIGKSSMTKEEQEEDTQIEKDTEQQEEGADSTGEESTDPSFIQKRMLANRPDPDGFKTCSQIEPDCAIMTDKVGGMYGEARDAVDRKMAEMDVKKKAYEREVADIQEQLASLVQEKNMAMQEVATQSEEIGVITAQRESGEERQRQQQRAYRSMWDGCKKEVNQIMFEGVCSILNVRKNVLDAAKGVLKVTPDKLEDCKMTEWAPKGDCSHKCVKRATMPNDETWKSLTNRHIQKYERSPIVSPPEKDKLALPCPQKMENFAQCNAFLCPVDCAVSRFSAWSPCTKKCGGGTRGKTRAVTKRPKHGGKMCDSLSETSPCNTFSCDVDCKLRRWPRWRDYGPCVRACRDPTDLMIGSPRKMPFRMGSRPVVRRAKGKGRCPKKWSKIRRKRRYCNLHRCRGDEKCVDRMDIVFAFDSSGSLGENGFETFKNFTTELTSRMLPQYFTWPATKVGIVQFGNGMLVKKKISGIKKTMVKPALMLTENGPIRDMKKVAKIVEGSKWQKGFTNMAQGIIAACKMLQLRGRRWATRKIVIISDGKPTLNFATNEAAQECKDRNVVIDFIVVNTGFNKDNAAWDLFKRLPSYPWNAHTHHVNGMNQLLMKPTMIASRILPRICPKARSVSRVIRYAARRGYLMIHRGRDCGNWWYPLGRFRRVRSCARAAKRKGFKGFVFQFHWLLRSRRGRYWCWSDKKYGKMAQLKKGEPFTPADNTCSCTNRYCTGRVKGGKKGWTNQRLLKYTGYSHYGVVDNVNEFIKEARAKPFALVAEKSEESIDSLKQEFIDNLHESDDEEQGSERSNEEDIAEMMKEVEMRRGN